jgi:nitrite reductase/ring-hydroxylating ferredoxin subunit
MRGITRLLRVLLVGRKNGLRARLRRVVFHRGASEPDASTVAEPPKTTPKSTAPTGFHAVLRTDQLKPGEVTEVIAAGTPIAVANVAGTYYALSNVCAHAGGPIGDGALAGTTVTCPYHGWSYDVRDGKCHVNADVHLPTYPVQVVGDAVCVKV